MGMTEFRQLAAKIDQHMQRLVAVGATLHSCVTAPGWARCALVQTATGLVRMRSDRAQMD